MKTLPGARKVANNQDLIRERLHPLKPLVDLVPFDAWERLSQKRHHAQWAAAVRQKRAKDLGFMSLSALRRGKLKWKGPKIHVTLTD